MIEGNRLKNEREMSQAAAELMRAQTEAIRQQTQAR